VKFFGNFLIVRRNNLRPSQAATDGRATTTANQRKAPQQAIDADQPPRSNKPNRVDRLGKHGVHQY
jgi:hypothetical protein